ncbi:MAG TPA: DNA gyrase inhibitor YacG [Phycisphaerae bacterium]|nr:DNA gyrase inhibitor YacG [Phycisphaerae bacterium]
MPVPTFRCVTCDRPVPWSGPLPDLYPFCSRRCKLVDLGRWFREERAIEYHPEPEELSEPPPPATPDDRP